jgi:hypothetical protein
MKPVFLISPFAGEIEANIIYGRRCMADCFARGEAAFAGHLLYTQPGVLRDEDPKERAMGIAAGHVWMELCDTAVVYLDRGLSKGMRADIERFLAINSSINIALFEGTAIEFRFLATSARVDEAWLHQNNVPHPKCGLCVQFSNLKGDSR